jgi:16S rRNA (cytosine967-C5)-methyltransferase
LRDGAALVQDEGSQLVARALTLAPVDGDTGRWLDLCAGPGGKTALLAALGADSGARVTAVEPAPRRADLVAENTRGLPVDVVRVDGQHTGLDPGFDRVPHLAETVGVVADALRRHPVSALDTRPLFEPVDEGHGQGPSMNWVQLWPHRHGTDAMFAAALRRLK